MSERFKASFVAWKRPQTQAELELEMRIREELKVVLDRMLVEDAIIEDTLTELKFLQAARHRTAQRQRSSDNVRGALKLKLEKLMHTKFGVDEEEVDKTATEALPKRSGAVHCPQCANIVLPQENYGGLRVCPNCGTAPFERKP